MAKSRDQIIQESVQEQLGVMAFNIVVLTADLKAANERIAELEAEKAPHLKAV